MFLDCGNFVDTMCVFPLLLIFTEAADLLQKLSLDAQAKPVEIPEPTKKVLLVRFGDGVLYLCRCLARDSKFIDAP